MGSGNLINPMHAKTRSCIDIREGTLFDKVISTIYHHDSWLGDCDSWLRNFGLVKVNIERGYIELFPDTTMIH